jgi:hypothetical protein
LILVLDGIPIAGANLMRPIFRCVVLSVMLSSGPLALAREPMPWVFRAPPAEGYEITLNSIEPAPGTPLKRGSEVEFVASVTYRMTVANEGVVVLVCQDEKNRPVTEMGKQLVEKVSGSSGAVTLRQRVTIPKKAKEIRVFIPIVPAGLTETTGEITVRYPVVKP